jgi:segregation and condensation protein B
MKQIKSKIESLLFISAKPMALSQLVDLLKDDKDKVMKAGDELVEDYKSNQRGIQIIKNGSKYQMVSSPENAQLVQEFIKDETTGELSRPSLETLTIIAYRGPISKAELNQIRGINCALILRNLLIRGLIEVKNIKSASEEEADGQSEMYSVTFDFIRFLGINDVKELPDYEKLSQDNIVDQILHKEEKNEKPTEEAIEESASIDNIIEEQAEEAEAEEEKSLEEAVRESLEEEDTVEEEDEFEDDEEFEEDEEEVEGAIEDEELEEEELEEEEN